MQQGPHNLPVALLSVLMLTGCFRDFRIPEPGGYERKEELLVPPDARRIEIQLHRGHVLLLDAESIRCSAEITVHASNDEIAALQGDTVRIESSLDDGTWRLRASHAAGAELDAVAIAFRIGVPARIPVVVRANDARVALRGYRGDADLRTESGSIDARPDGGACVLGTGSGSIRLDGRFGRAQVETHTGEVEISLPPSRSTVSLQVTSDTGPVVIDMDAECRMKLHYTTRSSGLRSSDFPVRWTRLEQNPDDDGQTYVGVLGNEDSPGVIDARVRSRTGSLEVRMRPQGSAHPAH